MRSPIHRWTAIDRLIPAMGLLVFGAVFYRALRIGADWSDATIWLWLYVPQEKLFGLSTAAFTAILVTGGALASTFVVWMEAGHLGPRGRACTRLATISLAAVLIAYACMPLLLRDRLIDSSIRLLRRYGDDRVGWQSGDIRGALESMGIEVAPSAPQDAPSPRP